MSAEQAGNKLNLDSDSASFLFYSASVMYESRSEKVQECVGKLSAQSSFHSSPLLSLSGLVVHGHTSNCELR